LVGKAYDAAGNIGASTSVAFTINNTGPTPTTYNEVENNGTARTANVIADTVAKIVGYIGAPADEDYFKITVAAGRTVAVKMTGPAAKDYDLYLLSSSGTTLKTSANVGATESVAYTNAGAASANYYIKVVAFGGAYTTTTPYNLALSR
jgi:vibriolysin